MSKPKILTVDDKTKNLFAPENFLTSIDVELVKAASGNNAWKETQNHKFTLAILNVQIPIMVGYKLAELMRGEEKLMISLI